MANSLSLIAATSLTQDSPASAAAGPASAPAGSSSIPGTSSPSAAEQPKRKRGRPKGSTTKKPGDAASASVGSAEPKLKRPVGRPRKDGLPAGSVPKRPPVKKPKLSDPARGPPHDTGHFLSGFPPWAPGVGYSPHHPHPAPSIQYIPQDTKFVLDEWGELVQTDLHSFFLALLDAVTAPNPTSTTGPTVEEAFKIHLQSLAPNPATTSAAPTTHNIPSLYSILRTFWLPSSPSYFNIAASASNTRIPMEYRFLYWDPQPLVFNGIQCPFCPCPLINNGRILSGPIKVYDLDKPFFIIGCEYVCTSPQCTASTTPEGRKFSSTDASIMNSLPKGLKDEFPARLLFADTDAGSGSNIWNWSAMGVSTALWNLVMGGLSIGLRKETILQLVKSIQYGPPEIKYEMKEEDTASGIPINTGAVAGGRDEEFDPADGGVANGIPDSTAADTTAQSVVQNGWNVDKAQTRGDPAHPNHSPPSFHPARGQPPAQPQPAPSSLITPAETIDSTQHSQHPDMFTRSRGQPQPQTQPPQNQPRQSASTFSHYGYPQYPYYPDQSASAAGPSNTGRPGTTAGANQLAR